MRELCDGENRLVERGTNSRMTCPDCGARLSATTAPVRMARGLYLRVPTHYRADRDAIIGVTQARIVCGNELVRFGREDTGEVVRCSICGDRPATKYATDGYGELCCDGCFLQSEGAE